MTTVPRETLLTSNESTGSSVIDFNMFFFSLIKYIYSYGFVICDLERDIFC